MAAPVVKISKQLRSSLPAGFLLSGYYYTSGANNLGSNGNYWSRTANSAQNAYNLNLNSSSVNPANNNNKYNGNSVRCVAK